jgi:creatinine amidohydrolase
MLDYRSTSQAIGEATPEIAVFGVGAVEQHSTYLPLGTDWLGVSDLTERVAKELDAFLVPALPFSMSECHGPMAGTVWLKPETLAAVVRDTVLSLRAQGIHRVLLINGHGGNFVLEAEVRRINLAYPDLTVLMVPPLVGRREGEERIMDKGVGIHASEGETSRQLYINAENVKDERVDYQPPVGREFLDYAFIGFISEWGVWGYPSYGTAEKGEKLTARRVAGIVEWAGEAFDRVEALKRSDEES